MSHLFLSHSSADKRPALRLAKLLEANGYRTWCFELDSAGDYEKRLTVALSDAVGILVLVSARSIKHRDQITREIAIAHTNHKWFMPLQYELTDAYWHKYVPQPWQEAFATAIRVPVHTQTLTATGAEIIKNLNGRGVLPGAVDHKRLLTITDEIERLDPRTLGQQRRELLLLGMLLVVTASVGWLWWSNYNSGYTPVPADWADDVMVWIRRPDALSNDHTYLSAINSVEKTLIEIGRRSGKTLRIIRDSDIDENVIASGCYRQEIDNISRCLRIHAVRRLNVRAKVDTMVLGDGVSRQLKLDIGHGIGVDSAQDAKFGGASLGPWGASRIAKYVGLEDAAIHGAIEEVANEFLKGQYADPQDLSWLPRLVSVAYASEEESEDQEAVRALIKQLRMALQSRQYQAVASLYVTVPPQQENAFRKYFDYVKDSEFTVEFEPVEPPIVFSQEGASVIFLRRDTFVDPDSRDFVRLVVKTRALLTREGELWKIKALEKAP
jgi:hypothetical protein